MPVATAGRGVSARRLGLRPAGASCSARLRLGGRAPARLGRRLRRGVSASAAALLGRRRRREPSPDDPLAVADHREIGADLGGLVLRDQDLLEHAGDRRRDLGVDLVGGDLEQRLVDLDLSPSFLSQRVTVPSVTLSPRAGMVTDDRHVIDSLDVLRWRSGRGQSVGVQRLAGQRQVASPSASFCVGCACTSGATSSGWASQPTISWRLADQLADPRADHVDADDRAVLDPHQLDEAGGPEDLALAVAAEVVVVASRSCRRRAARAACASVSPTEATSGSQ